MDLVKHKQYEMQMIDLLEGRLDESAEAALVSAIANSPELSATWASFQGWNHDLECIGQSFSTTLPQVDLLADVMAALDAQEAVSPVIVPMPAPRSFRLNLRSYGLAAAAAILLLAGGILLQLRGDTGSPVAPVANTVIEDDRPDAAPTTVDAQKDREQMLNVAVSTLKNVRKGMGQAKEGAEVFQAVTPVAEEAITLDAILKVTQNASLLSGRMGEIARGILNQERANEVIGSSNIAAAVGASDFVSLNDRIAALRRAVGQAPNNKAYRAALARAELETGMSSPESSSLIESLSQEQSSLPIEEQNALPYLLQAQSLFLEGDNDGALAVLELAMQTGTLDTFGAERASYLQEALSEANVERDASELLSLLNSSDYDFYNQMGQQLLTMGQEFQTAGDMESALRYFQMAQRYGNFVSDNSLSSLDQLAGADIQSDSIQQLVPLYGALGMLDEMGALEQDATAVETQYVELRSIFEGIADILTGDWESGTMTLLRTFVYPQST